MAWTFISGATGGIGKAFTIAVAKRKCDLFLTGRSEEKLKALKDGLVVYGVKVEYFACDLTKENERKAMFSYIDEKGLKFDRVINVAGVDIQKAFCDYTIEKVLFQMRVNCESTIANTFELIKRKEENLEIITISSMSGVSPMPYFALYSASKSMLTNFFTSLHYELKKQAKVTVVLPGGVPTRPDVIKDIKGQGLWGKLSSKSPEYVAEKSLKKVKKNKMIFVPGFFNKLLYFIIKISPKRIVLSFIARRWKKQTKDAF